MPPRPAPGPDRTRRSVLLSAAGMTVLAGLSWLPEPAATSRSLGPSRRAAAAGAQGAGGDLHWTTAVRRPLAAARTAPGAAGGHEARSGPATVRAARSLRAVHPGVESSVPAGEADLVLSIDDGPSPQYTPQILAILRRWDVKATFCMVGSCVAAYPEVAKAVAADGHQLANHTWSHAWLPHLSHHAMVEEVERAQLALDRVTGGAAPTVFRAPFGAWSPAILQLCWRNRMRAVGWSIDPKDWSRPPTRAIVSDVLANAAPGRIILDHDGGGDRSHTVAAIRTYLPRLLHLGYRFVLP